MSAKKIVTLVYALQAVSFFLGFTFFISLIIIYVKDNDVKGSWLESHFKWQKRTFWFGLLWTIIGLASLLIVIGYFILLLNTVWIIYRITKGWLRLNEGKEMYVNS
ncbi:MAG: hypothetical protein L3J59_13140 [Methylococcaceae bacterium]|nr:hypothetical protein [Methylococcaceae bacterium]